MAVTDPRTSPRDDSPVISRLNGPPSLVARRGRPWGTILGAIAIAIVGMMVFSSLSQARQTHTAAVEGTIRAIPVSASAPLMPIPNVSLATTPVQAQPMAPVVAEPELAPAPDPSVGWKAPAMVVDMPDQAGPTTASVSGPGPVGQPQATRVADQRLSDDERFDARIQASSVETVRATRLKDTSLIAPQGTVIPAVTETAINLDLPGFARAVVSRDVRGFDGATVLIPKGSQLIGQYRAGAASGQSRAYVVWSRLLTPDGVSVDIGSPAADRLGEGGVPGETNTHFFRRFGSAILLSVLSAGLDAAAASASNNTTSVVIGSQQQTANVASIALQKDINIPDTVTVAQGTPIRVFIARDLDFSGVVQKAR